MRLLTILLFCFLLISCNENVEVTSKSTKDFSFMLGDWKRTNEEDGKTTYEHWRSTEIENLRGLSYTLQDGDTIFKETLRIFKIDSSWILRVTGFHDAPVDFEITSKDTLSFIAENAQNEFPSKIAYTYTNDLLTAQVSGDAMDISFIYKKIED